jgi:ubiquinone/menaquinone biosynthesis C-methylase UbiE
MCGMTTFESEWQTRFSRYARTHDREAAISGWSEEGLRRRYALFQSLLPALDVPSGARVLDLGCGAGTYVRLLAGLGHRVVGLDYSLPTLERAVAMDSGRKAEYLAGEAYGLPFRDRSFDLVVSIGVMQALGRPTDALAELARVIEPGGTLVVEALNGRSVLARSRQAREWLLRKPPRVRAYPRREVERWLQRAGFSVLGRARLCLPPRRFPALTRMLDHPTVARLVETTEPFATLAAHTALFVARRDGHGTRVSS